VVKRRGPEADYVPSSSAEAKKECSYTFHSAIFLLGVLTYKVNFAFNKTELFAISLITNNGILFFRELA
jgi:hypothetical protein